MTRKDALRFVAQHGVVLESARGPVESLAAAIAGGPILGSWWGHAKSHEIFAATRAARDSDDILVCRLVSGKITYVHRRLWPALVRLSDRFAARRLDWIREVHTAAGRHETQTVPFPDWVPPEVRKQSQRMSEEDAERELLKAGNWLGVP